MIKRNNKKGFTIVELVIVIAVIAILAAVLIPTFAGIIKKANLSADQQAVRQMNVALVAASATEKPADLDALVKTLADAGYNSEDSLIPVTKDHVFYWYMTYNTIVLANGNEVIAPTDNDDLIANFAADLAKDGADKVLFDLRAGVAKIEVKDDASFMEAAMQGYKDITLAEDFVMADGMSINTPANATMTIDLGGKTLTTGWSDVPNKKHTYAVNVYGTVTIENGVIDARGIQVMKGGKLILGEGVTVNAVDTNGGAAVWVYKGAEVVIDGGIYTAMNGEMNYTDLSKNPGAINNSGKLTINGGTFTSAETVCYLINNSGELIINGGKFEGTHGVIANYATTTINGGEFTLKAYNSHSFDGYLVYCTSGSVIINGGTFSDSGSTYNEGVDFYTSGTGTVTVKKGVVLNGSALDADITYPQK